MNEEDIKYFEDIQKEWLNKLKVIIDLEIENFKK